VLPGGLVNAVLAGLASNPALPPGLLDRLIAVPSLADELARRPDLSPHHVRALLAFNDAAVTHALLEKGWVAPADVPLTNPHVAPVTPTPIRRWPVPSPPIRTSRSASPSRNRRALCPPT
jgi:hypothetical protein